jgi:hypothetical protein
MYAHVCLYTKLCLKYLILTEESCIMFCSSSLRKQWSSGLNLPTHFSRVWCVLCLLTLHKYWNAFHLVLSKAVETEVTRRSWTLSAISRDVLPQSSSSKIQVVIRPHVSHIRKLYWWKPATCYTVIHCKSFSVLSVTCMKCIKWTHNRVGTGVCPFVGILSETAERV